MDKTPTSAEKLAEFKAATRDRNTHPDKAQRLWEEFIALVEKESREAKVDRRVD